MLGPGRYLLGVLEILLLGGFAWIGAARLRWWLLPRVGGAPAHLGTSVIALALLIWAAEVLGTFGVFEAVPYVLVVVVLGLSLWKLLPPAAPSRVDPRAGAALVPTMIALVIAALAVIHFSAGVKTRLSTGMTGFDSTWYHGPFAAGFFQSGDTMDLHFIAPQFLAWFYPANGEIFHAAGMLAFGRDVLSPVLNLGWFVGCLVACWCIGRPYRVGAWSLGLGAIALSVPALSDQAGEARNDIVGIFFLLAALAIALNAWAARAEGEGEGGLSTGALALTGLAAGLAAGTKLNFLLPAAVLVTGLVPIQAWVSRDRRDEPERREAHQASSGRAAGRALAAAGLAALAGGGYWYLRNLVHSGNPLPWIHHLGPISLPAPEQGLGGREAHSVLGYLTDGTVWSDWFLPGLHHGLWIVWPLLGAAAIAGLVLSPLAFRGSFWTKSVPKESRNGEPVLALAGLVGLATALAWLIAPTSASGPDGMPRGFESGLRYLAPALVLGLALLSAAPQLRRRLRGGHAAGLASRRLALGIAAAAILLAVAAGYPVQRHYLHDRYSDPTFSAPGLDAAFAWADDISGARIATTSTRQYPLFGTDLSNRVQFVGEERPHGGFEAPGNCRRWREELNAGRYDYVVASSDRLEPGRPPFPPQASWTEGPQAKVILRKPPTVVFELTGPLDPSSCSS